VSKAAVSHDTILDLATEVRRGQKTLKDINPKIVDRVTDALRKPIVLQQHARRRERELNPMPSRFQAPRQPRARFV
jgi:hypothetical protein